jgi:hypothetical protein
MGVKTVAKSKQISVCTICIYTSLDIFENTGVTFLHVLFCTKLQVEVENTNTEGEMRATRSSCRKKCPENDGVSKIDNNCN